MTDSIPTTRGAFSSTDPERRRGGASLLGSAAVHGCAFALVAAAALPLAMPNRRAANDETTGVEVSLRHLPFAVSPAPVPARPEAPVEPPAPALEPAPALPPVEPVEPEPERAQPEAKPLEPERAQPKAKPLETERAQPEVSERAVSKRADPEATPRLAATPPRRAAEPRRRERRGGGPPTRSAPLAPSQPARSPRAQPPARRVSRRTRAEVVKRVEPDYPRRCRRRGHFGAVVVGVRVANDGRVASAQIARSAGCRRLDEAALEATQSFRFKPATLRGQPVASSEQLVFRFEPAR